ncbi:MAG: integrase core domain-containing protein, partial [Candidatus Binataceae bacterium]
PHSCNGDPRSPYCAAPWQNGHVERLIGSIRRESLDHLIVFGEAHLRGVLEAYASYYNEVRTRLSLDKDAPDFRRAQKFGRIAEKPILGGSIINTSGFRFWIGTGTFGLHVSSAV